MLKNLIYSLITKGAVALINFIILIVSSRYLGVSSRGEISIFILNITIIQIINEIYTGYNIVHFIPRFDLKKILVIGICYSLLFCSLSNVIVVFLNKQVKDYEWLGYIVSVLVILNTFNCVLILGKENFRLYNLLSFIQPFLLLAGILIYIFLFRIYTFEAYVIPLLISFSLAIIISWAGISKFFPERKLKTEFQLRPIVVNGFIFQAGILMHIFINRYSYYLLPDVASVGLYASASSLMESVLIIVNSIAPVLLARVANQGNTSGNIEMTLSLSKASFLFSLLVVLVVALLPSSFFVFVFGAGFSGIKELMVLYTPGILMVSLFGSISYYFSAIGKQRLVLVCYSLGFISTLVFAPVLVRLYNNAGAAYSANLAYFLVAVGICMSFFRMNKLSIKRFFYFTEDLKNLSQLVAARSNNSGPK